MFLGGSDLLRCHTWSGLRRHPQLTWCLEGYCSLPIYVCAEQKQNETEYAYPGPPTTALHLLPVSASSGTSAHFQQHHQWSSGRLSVLFKYTHTREGMPRLELVVPRGRPLLRPGWDRVRLALPENVTLIELSPLAPRPGFRPFFLRCPAPEVRQGGRSCCRPGAIGERQPFHPMVVRFTSVQLGPPRSRGSPCGPGTSVSRFRWRVPACIGSRSLASPVWRRSTKDVFTSTSLSPPSGLGHFEGLYYLDY